MAKRGVLDHPKNLDLAQKLKIMPPFSLGVLEAFWHWTGKYRPTGDITGTDPHLFAVSIRYAADADALWNALVSAGWIERDGERMLVHDWSEHADDAVRKYLKRRGESFADGSGPFDRKVGQSRDSVVPMSRLSRADVATESGQGGDIVTTAACLPIPVPVPEPIPVPEPVLNPAPAMPAPEHGTGFFAPDDSIQSRERRFVNFRTAVIAWWRDANGGSMPWDGSEQRRLKEFLQANPALTIEEFRTLLENRGRSDVNLAERPRAWLATLTNYANGRLDRFGKPERITGASRAADPDAGTWDLIHSAELAPEYARCVDIESRVSLVLKLAPDHVPRDGLADKLRSLITTREHFVSNRKEPVPC
ncbi:MAG TPA: hypothetical protein VGF88_23520 [Acidobacteriaceae bacterium]|jgi:hypothetical protein